MSFRTFEDRYNYARLVGEVGALTFGSSRYLNQAFYRSARWKQLRNEIIIRDDGCDLGIPDRMIGGRILVHHLNPVTEDDLLNRDYDIFNPENLICVSNNTHQAIHYGDGAMLMHDPIERTKNDTIPWK
jgi:hypothetical protein